MSIMMAGLQMIGTLGILAWVPGNAVKVMCLVPLWLLTFQGFSRREWISYLVINIIFVASDIGAIQNGFFFFQEPDVLGLPYWEFLMWGFYLLHTARLFPAKEKLGLDWKVVVLAVLFSALFAVMKDRQTLLVLTTLVLAATLLLFRSRQDFLYAGYLMLMGVAFEYVGLRFQLWSYPENNYQTALVQFVVMWGGCGLFFRRILGATYLAKTEGGKRPRRSLDNLEEFHSMKS